MRLRALLRYRKDPRVVVTIPLVILAATTLVYYLMQRANELSPEALRSRLLLFVLWNINLILVLGILFVLLRGVVKLMLERHRGTAGSRFRSKLVATHILVSLIPIGLLFFIATDLLRVSVDRWFNMPVRKLLTNSEQIAQMGQDRAIAQAEQAARELAASSGNSERALNHVLEYHGVDLVGIYQGGALLRSIANPRSPVHAIREPSVKFFQDVREKGSARKIDVTPQGKWIRYGTAVGDGPDLVAVTGVFIPAATSRLIDENLIAYQNFLQLDAQRPALKAAQISLLLSVTLFLLFGSLWTAVVVSRRITVPIEALAEGTRSLAQGRYGHHVEVEAADEVGVLVNSFNQMSSELYAQREALTDTNRRLDEERAFLLTVMESVSTGIIAVSDTLELLSMNRAALRILQIDEPPREVPFDRALQMMEIPEIAAYFGDLANSGEPRSREITLIRGGELRYLEVSAAHLSGTDGGHGGWVVALEDLTQLAQAQKLAAWNEAARRIAHEIKNPLTPIQLSAERIARKYRTGEGDVGHVIDEGTRTIVKEVGQLKRMVDEFSRFARMPAINLRQTRIEQILREVAQLYAEIKPGVSVVVDADSSLQAVIDPEQIRRALINLLDNAVEATDRGLIRLCAEMRGRTLVIEVSDPGRGVPDSDKEKLFLPYFSTKGRDTGLGLAIVHRIVHDHEGRISVHDNEPHGTRFEIEIPA